MKKTYLRPVSIVLGMSLQTMVCTSGVTSNNGIDYGGVDEEGTMTPAARRRHRRDMWDDEEEEKF